LDFDTQSAFNRWWATGRPKHPGFNPYDYRLDGPAIQIWMINYLENAAVRDLTVPVQMLPNFAYDLAIHLGP
jgi:hypothetical protein